MSKMNENVQSLIEKKSVRVFKEEPITKLDKMEILQAAMESHTAGNRQMYTILDITDQNLKNILARSYDYQPFIAMAPMALIFCADCQKWQDAYEAGGCEPGEPEPGEMMLAAVDAVIAAQNAVAAAERLGIGSCYIGDVMERCGFHKELFSLPEYVFPVAMVVFGYPSTGQETRKSPDRCAMEYIVHENTYHRLGEEELKAMFAPQYKGQTFQEWIQARRSASELHDNYFKEENPS